MKSTEIYFDLDAKAPSVPSDIQKSGMANDRINISWLPSVDNTGLAVYYTRYLYDFSTKSLISTSTTTGTNETITGLVNGGAYLIGVSATDVNNNESAQSTLLKVVIDLDPPTIPTGLNTVSGQNTVRRLSLTWNASTDANLVGYYIYKDGVKINEKPTPNLFFTVTGIADVYKSEYSVKAVDINENLSGESNKLTVTPPVLIVDPNNIRVGIGVYNPEERLDVDENIQINDGNLIFKGVDGNNLYSNTSNDISIQSLNSITGNTIINAKGGNVGIGKINPTSKLDVVGNIRNTGNISSGGTITGLELNINKITTSIVGADILTTRVATVTGNLVSDVINNKNTIFSRGLNTTNLVATSIGDIYNLNSTVLSAINGNIEVGNFSNLNSNRIYTEALTVVSGFVVLDPYAFPAQLWRLNNGEMTYNGNVKSNGMIKAGDNLVISGSDAAGGNVINANNGALKIQNTVNNNNTIINGLSGNVGIGTVNPLAKLDISGNVRIVGSLMNDIIYTKEINGNGGSSDILINKTAGKVFVGNITEGVGKFNVSGGIYNDGNITTTGLLLTNNILTNGVVTSNGFVTLNNTSKIGIAQWDALKINVNGNIEANGILANGVVTSNGFVTLNYTSKIGIAEWSASKIKINGNLEANGILANGVITANGIKILGDGGGTVGSMANWVDDGTITYLQNRKVGIGKNGADEMLDVNGAVKANELKIGAVANLDNTGKLSVKSIQVNGSEAAIDNAGKLSVKSIQVNGGTTYSDLGALNLWTKIDDNNIAYNKKVSIGKATATLTQLDVVGDMAIMPTTNVSYGSEGARFYFTNNNADVTDDNDPIYFTRLNTASNRSVLRLVIGDDNWDQADDQFDIGYYSNGTFGTVASFKSSGKVIFKNIVDAKEFHACIAPGTCPDYVFEKDYQLMPLGELRTYLAKNKHLPEVPSAKEVEANGMELTEMNLILLKKVEELTLYILKLEEKIEKGKK